MKGILLFLCIFRPFFILFFTRRLSRLLLHTCSVTYKHWPYVILQAGIPFRGNCMPVIASFDSTPHAQAGRSGIEPRIVHLTYPSNEGGRYGIYKHAKFAQESYDGGKHVVIVVVVVVGGGTLGTESPDLSTHLPIRIPEDPI